MFQGYKVTALHLYIKQARDHQNQSSVMTDSRQGESKIYFENYLNHILSTISS